MLHLHVDPHNGIPVYRQVMDQVRYHVASGTLKPGDQAPSIRDLARALHVNPTTIVRAYTELEHEGLVEMQPGRGVFVSGAGRRMSAREREAVLRRAARQLAVEAVQTRAPLPLVLRVVREEMEALTPEVAHV